MDYRSAADFLKLLAHPTRLRIVAALSKGERCVSNLENLLELKQANVSQHLSLLTRAGLLASRRDGMRTCYRLVDEKVVPILEILGVEMDPASWECTSNRSE
ncbi:MAG: winged helix-turn-helix transcriptional regulator [Firmicutes bacterium]|nr:winged helix-turn-helix transcriptional regulator [Bacillota bacterium]